MNTLEIDQEKVRNCIKAFMQVNSISQQELAKRMQLSLQTVSNYISNKKLTERTIRKIAHALNYPEDLLLKGVKYYGTDEAPSPYELLEKRVRHLEEMVNKLMQN